MKKSYAKILLEAVLILLAAVEFFPLFLLLSGAFKTREEMAYNPLGFPGRMGFTMENVTNAIFKMKFYQPLLNSIIITAASLLLLTAVSSMAAYPLARKKSKLFAFLYIFFLSGIMVPYQLAMVPLYKLVKVLGLMNKEIGLILIYCGIFISFPIFVYSGFIKSVPLELEESAYIDGCGRHGIFWRIVFPLLKPATATVMVLSILNLWNDFIFSFLFLQKPSKMTVMVALYAFRGQYHVNWPHMFGGLVVAISPVILFFMFMQRYFIEGITAGAVKG